MGAPTGDCSLTAAVATELCCLAGRHVHAAGQFVQPCRGGPVHGEDRPHAEPLRTLAAGTAAHRHGRGLGHRAPQVHSRTRIARTVVRDHERLHRRTAGADRQPGRGHDRGRNGTAAGEGWLAGRDCALRQGNHHARARRRVHPRRRPPHLCRTNQRDSGPEALPRTRGCRPPRLQHQRNRQRPQAAHGLRHLQQRPHRHIDDGEHLRARQRHGARGCGPTRPARRRSAARDSAAGRRLAAPGVPAEKRRPTGAHQQAQPAVLRLPLRAADRQAHRHRSRHPHRHVPHLAVPRAAAHGGHHACRRRHAHHEVLPHGQRREVHRVGTAPHPRCHGGILSSPHQDGHCADRGHMGARRVWRQPLRHHGRHVCAGITGQRVRQRCGQQRRLLPHRLASGHTAGMRPHAVRHVAHALGHHQLRIAHRQQHPHAHLWPG